LSPYVSDGIVFDSKKLKRSIHPSIDLVDDIFVVGEKLPVRANPDGEIEEMLCFITSNKEIYRYDEFLEKGYKAKHFDVLLTGRWKPELVHQWIYDGGTEKGNVLKRLEDTFEHFIFLIDEPEYSLCSLWTVGTYLLPIWDAYPYLDIIGIRRSGKTQLILLLQQLAFNAVLSSNISGPSLFRLTQSLRPTVLIDEAERLSEPERLSDIRQLLLSGYKKGGYAIRSIGKEKKVPTRFEVYSPKAIVSIHGLEEYVADRSIQIIMRRAPEDDPRNKRPIRENDPRFEKVRHELYSFALSNWKPIQNLYDEIEIEKITARELEIWKPILTLAEYFGIYDEIYELAMDKIKVKRYEDIMETKELVLLRTLLRMVEKDDYYRVSAIKNKMQSEYEEEQRWLTSHWVGRALNRLGFIEKRKIERGWERFLRKEEVERVAALHGIERGAETHDCEMCEQKYGRRRPATHTIREGELEIHLCDECYEEQQWRETHFGGKTLGGEKK